MHFNLKLKHQVHAIRWKSFFRPTKKVCIAKSEWGNKSCMAWLLRVEANLITISRLEAFRAHDLLTARNSFPNTFHVQHNLLHARCSFTDMKASIEAEGIIKTKPSNLVITFM